MTARLDEPHRNLLAACAVLVALLSTLPLAATSIRIEPMIDSHGPVSVALTAVPVGTPSNAGEIAPVDLAVEAPWLGTVQLDPRIIWRVTASAEGFWAPETILDGGEQGATVRLWPTAELVGGVVPPPGEEPPEEISVRFLPAPLTALRSELTLPEGTVECPIEAGRFSCSVPAGTVDLRLRSPSFVSHYLWGVELATGETHEVGTLTLRPGASVTGFVAAEDGVVDPESCEVSLTPFVAGLPASIEDHRRRGDMAISAQINGRGFFHFEGLEPGLYTLTARQLEWAPARRSRLPVEARSETELTEPLLLHRPVELALSIEPAVDAGGKPWTVVVEQRQGEAAIDVRYDTVAQGRATADGLYRRRGLAPGPYAIQVLAPDGSRIAWQEIVLSEPTGTISVRLDITAITGLLLLGEEPLAAQLIFGGRSGAERIAMTSDGEGTFSGVLPRAGEWPVYIQAATPTVRRTVTVEVPEPEESGPAPVKIALPDSRVAGVTVDEQGTTVEKALVKLVDPGSGEIQWERSDDEGRFLFAGVAEGTVFLDAEQRERSPALLAIPQAVLVTEGGDSLGGNGTELQLVLRQVREITGQVVAAGAPLPGASLEIEPKSFGRSYPFMVTPQTSTDMAGQFRLEIPADADTLEITVLPPGHALTLLTLYELPTEPVVIPVEPAGGSLTLEAEDGAALAQGRSVTAAVLYQGTLLDVTLLSRWAALNGTPPREPGVLRVPQLPPGSYAACWLTMEDYQRTLTAGAGTGGLAAFLLRQTEAGRCAGGQLATYGELTLRLPERDREGAQDNGSTER